MKQILLFPDLETTPISSQGCYLALRASSLSAEALRALTPHLMLWEEDLWLLHLTPCMSYWELHAQAKQKTIQQILEEEIQNMCHSQKASPDGEVKVYTACMGYDPWWSLLSCSLLASRNLRGFFSSHQKITKNLWSALSWSLWWQLVHTSLLHEGDKKKLSNFQKSKRHMQLTMRRLNLASPHAAKDIPSSQIRRRFGVTIASFWERTWAREEGKLSAESESFPWKQFLISERAEVTRHLDSLLCEWDDIAEILRADLNRLAFLDSFKEGQRILAMEWKIVLYDLQEILLPILFRHPHCIRQESPHQRTALLQALYAFQSNVQKHKRVSCEPSWIAGWTVSIRTAWQQPLIAKSLFEPEAGDFDTLMTLENQLERPLESYQVITDWVPEDSFQVNSTDRQLDASSNRNIVLLGRQRPLFLMKAIHSFEAEGQSRIWKFRERTMDKWWHKNRSLNSVRDYYQVLSQDRLAWVFRDEKGRFFLHGIYG
jgi:hypothetical protein